MKSWNVFSSKKIKSFIFKTCPKTGRIYGVRKDTIFHKIFFVATGIAALLWFLIRVIPKPSRASYPCMQVAAPVAFTFVGFLSTIFLSAFGFRKALQYFKTNKFSFAILFTIIAVVSILTNVVLTQIDSFAQAGVSNGKFTPIDKPNTPLGVPDGIFPGRVTWVHDPAATNWDGTSNYWWSTANNNQAAISNMMIKAVNNIAGGTTIADSWDILFKNLNKKKVKGNVGYKAGEKIVIKINLNSNGSNFGTNNWLDASPQTVYALLNQLVNSAGVAQADICIYDAIRNTGMGVVMNYCNKDFPNVSYQNWGGWVANAIKYSSNEITGTDCRRLPTKVVQADYLINMALLKRHSQLSNNWVDGDGQTEVTLCGKNHFGTCGAPSELHAAIQDWRRGMGTYNPIVDLMGSKYLGGNTVLYLLDGLYCSSLHETVPVKWQMAPFNNDWPSSIFASLDQCAIESVGLDFLNAEWGLAANADNYLHEASQANNPPSKTNYNPDGVTLKSLGVHEHWNNATDKQYSRNLGTGLGIELSQIEIVPNTKPEIATQPKSVTLPLGLTATLKVDVTGQTPLTYQWKKNGVDIPNATTATLTLPNISATDESSYTVVITNVLGTVESDIATVVIGASEGIASAKKTTTPLVIDGTLNEALWSLPYSVSKVVVGATANNTETYGILWDDTYLYVGVKVLDATITTTNIDPYQNDAVELYFDMNHTGGVYDNSDRSWIKVVNSTNIWEKIGAPQGAVTNNSAVKAATAIITGGYTMEFAIPWTSLGITPKTANLYGFDVAVDDADGGIRINQNVWMGTMDDWQNLTGIGDLVLLAPNTGSLTQTISLVKGWNLISFNVSPTDNTIVNVFKPVLNDVIEIKNADAFWMNGQDPITNSLTAISEGMGYFVKMNVARDLIVSGAETKSGLPTMKTGWNLIGCPYQTPTALSTLFTPTNTSAVKNFEGFWMPTGTINSIQNLEPGKGYFLKKP